MNENIIIVAEKLISEATAIIKYTEDLKKIPEHQESTRALLEDIRLDEVEHIQKLTVELTTLVAQPNVLISKPIHEDAERKYSKQEEGRNV